MTEPPTPIDDRTILPWAKKLVEWLRENRIEAGPGIRLRRTRTATILTSTPAATAQDKPVPLHLITTRPAYMPVPASPLAGGAKRCWITWGTLNDQLSINWDSHFDVTDTTYFFAKATFKGTESLKVDTWEIVTGANYNTHETPDWPVGAARPAYAVYGLGSLTFINDLPYVFNSGGGSLAVGEYLTSIEQGSRLGEAKYGKAIGFQRQNY